MEQMAESPTRLVGHPGSHQLGQPGPNVDGAFALTDPASDPMEPTEPTGLMQMSAAKLATLN